MNKISVTESWKFGWKIFKKNWQILIYATAIPFLAGIILDEAFGTGKGDGTEIMTSRVMFLVALAFVLKYLVRTLFNIGQTRIFIKSNFGGEAEKPKYSDLFNTQGIYLRFLATSVLFGLVFLGGFILLIIPGIYLGIRYLFAPILVVDKRMDIGEAFLKSKEMTKGIKWQILGFLVISAVFILLGLIGFAVGIVITYIIFQLAFVHMYRKILNESNKEEQGGQMNFADVQSDVQSDVSEDANQNIDQNTDQNTDQKEG